MKRHYKIDSNKQSNSKIFNDSGYFENYESEDDQWESVVPDITEDNCEEPLEIIINENPSNEKIFNVEKYLTRKFILEKVKLQKFVHQINILLLLARGRYWNKLSCHELIKAVALSHLVVTEPNLKFPCDPSVANLQNIYLFCRKNYKVHKKCCKKCKCFLLCVKTKRMCCRFSFVWLYAALVRALGWEVRVVSSLDAVPLLIPKKARRLPFLNIKKLANDFNADNSCAILKKLERIVSKIGIYKPNKKFRDILWVEVYDAPIHRWRIIDVNGDGMNSMRNMERIYSPLTYIISYNNNNEIRDQTPRYCTKWPGKGHRLPPSWFAPIFLHFGEKVHLPEITPVLIPHKQCAFLDHPDYVLDRFIGKTQCVFPQKTRPITRFGNYWVYPRACVYQLRSLERWMKMGRQIKDGEFPYRTIGVRREGRSQRELYGLWQTEVFTPPVAQDGVVPRNRYGNVYMFSNEMLPVGTVHLNYSGIDGLAKEMGIDIVRAMVGWEIRNGSCRPKFDGFVVCMEEAGRLVDEYEGRLKRESEQMRKELVLLRWRRIFHHALIRIRVMERYGLTKL